MKKNIITLICLLLILLCSCGKNGDMPTYKSLETLTTESLSLLDQMARSDDYLGQFITLVDEDQKQSTLDKIRSVSDLADPEVVYDIEINEEKLLPLVLKTSSELPEELKNYMEEKVNLSIASLFNGKKGTDYIVFQTALTAKYGGFCSGAKEDSVILNVYETGYPVLSVAHPLNDGYVEVSSAVLFIDVTSENTAAEIKDMLDSIIPFSFVESVDKK